VQRDELPTGCYWWSAHDESAIVFRALQEGAAGFLPKESTRSELVNAVLELREGPATSWHPASLRAWPARSASEPNQKARCSAHASGRY